MSKNELPETTMIDVVARCGNQTHIKQMSIKEWRELAKKPGWSYIPYQIGYHSYTTQIHDPGAGEHHREVQHHK